MIQFTEEQIRDISREEVSSAATRSQYGVTKVPTHTHDNVDSVPISPSNVVGNLQTTKSPVNVGRSIPPTIGQSLVATSPTTATWQTISSTPNDWMFDGKFSSLSDTMVQWTSGTLLDRNGTPYSIVAGNTGTMVVLTYIFFDVNVSTTVLQVTTTPANARGSGRILIGVAQNGVLNTQGATIFTDNFDSYTNGNLDSQGSWNSSTNDFFDVESSVSYSPTKGVVSNTNFSGLEVGISKVGTPLTDGTITVYARNTEVNAGGGKVLIVESGSGISLTIKFFNNTGIANHGIFQYVAASSATFGPLMSENVWYAMSFQWRSSDHMVRFAINGVWTAWVGVTTPWTTGFDTVSLVREVGGANIFYFDSIQQLPTYALATFQIFGGSGGIQINSSQISDLSNLP